MKFNHDISFHEARPNQIHLHEYQQDRISIHKFARETYRQRKTIPKQNLITIITWLNCYRFPSTWLLAFYTVTIYICVFLIHYFNCTQYYINMIYKCNNSLFKINMHTSFLTIIPRHLFLIAPFPFTYSNII